jgi:hypothetical protein
MPSHKTTNASRAKETVARRFLALPFAMSYIRYISPADSPLRAANAGFCGQAYRPL